MKYKWILEWILVAEDDKNDADLTMDALKTAMPQADDEVVVAHDGSEALDRPRSPQPFSIQGRRKIQSSSCWI